MFLTNIKSSDTIIKHAKHGGQKTALKKVDELWQINSNATLKILIKMVWFDHELEIQNKTKVNFWKANVFWNKIKHESLILAQDERWRRA